MITKQAKATNSKKRAHVGVIGGGVSGLASAWFLTRGGAGETSVLDEERGDHSPKVTLFEANADLGGHACTIEIAEKEKIIPIDTGFMVYNPLNYPEFDAFLRELQVETVETSMSFSVWNIAKRLAYNGTSIQQGFFPRIWNWLEFRRYQLLLEINRFHVCARGSLAREDFEGMTLEEYFEQHHLGRLAVEYYIKPMTAAIWSAPVDRVKKFPAGLLLRFLSNHGMLGYTTQFQWRTVMGGSREYVNRVERLLREEHGVSVEKGARIVELVETERGVYVISEERNGEKKQHGPFDYIIFATPADVTRRLMDASPEFQGCARERAALESFSYQESHVMVHSLSAYLPDLQKIWGSWNVLLHREEKDRMRLEERVRLMESKQKIGSQETDDMGARRSGSMVGKAGDAESSGGSFLGAEVSGKQRNDFSKASGSSFHYYMNSLQPLHRYGAKRNYFISLNAPFRPKEVHYETRARHVMLAADEGNAVETLTRKGQSQNEAEREDHKRRVVYAGSYLGYGFHEDGFVSGKRAAEEILDTLKNKRELLSVSL